MKTTDVFKALAKDNTQEFITTNSLEPRCYILRISPGGYYYLDCYKDGRLQDTKSDADLFNGNIHVNTEWEPIRKNVDFATEALPAWLDGKIITAERNGYIFHYNSMPPNNYFKDQFGNPLNKTRYCMENGISMTDEISKYFFEQYRKAGFHVMPWHWPEFKTREEVDKWIINMSKLFVGKKEWN